MSIAAAMLALACAPAHARTGALPDSDGTATASLEYGPMLGLRYGAPLRLSAYGGVGIARVTPQETPPFDHGDVPLVYSLLGEVGLRGARSGLGINAYAYMGMVRVQLSVLRTWDDDGEVRANETFVAPEVVATLVPFLPVGASVGYYWHVDDTRDSPVRFFAANLVVGF